MNEIFDFAMKMELDGKAYYEKLTGQTELPALKKILSGLADDENRHYRIFKALRETHGKGKPPGSGQGTAIIGTARNVFEQLAHEKSSLKPSTEVVPVWKHAQEIEKKSEDFYRSKAKEVTEPSAREILNRIADEEHAHWVLIESVLQFLARPKSWLENAEWSNLEPY